MKQILFNTDMVRAILDGRKTQTRRIVAPHIVDRFVLDKDGRLLGSYMDGEKEGYPTIDDAPHQEGDILYVRETWRMYEKRVCEGEECHVRQFYAYKADEDNPRVKKSSEWYNNVHYYSGTDICRMRGSGSWRPSIHMPKEAARIFLRVTGVRIERLQDISIGDAKAEGITWEPGKVWTCYSDGIRTNANISLYADLWNKINKHGCGWDANPWVWVYEFERVEAPNGKTTN